MNVSTDRTARAGQPRRRTQAERRAQTRSALLEAAARHLSRDGYGSLVLEQVARDAGYTRGALYHQFADKQDLVLAVLRWVDETWHAEVWEPAAEVDDPLVALLTIARRHAVFCRRDIARVMMSLRVEFSDREHPVGSVIQRTMDELVARSAALIAAARREGSVPPGPPAKLTAAAFMAGVEGVVIAVAGRAPHDEALAERAARGVLGVAVPPVPSRSR